MAEYLHFRNAAAALRMSQPALSSAISALEESLGTQLVERTTRKVLLTPVGERVAHHAAWVLADLDRLMDEVRVERGPLTGVLRVGVIPTVAPYLLPAVLPRLRRDFSELSLSVREDRTASSLAELLAGRLDLVILALPVPAVGLVERSLYEEDFVLVAPESYALDSGSGDAEPLSREVLGELDVLLLNEGHCLRDQTLEVCREVGARPTAATYATSLATLVQLVSGGLGVTMVPESAVLVETRRGAGLSVRHFAEPAPFRRIGIAYRNTSPRDAEFDAFAAVIRDCVRAGGWNVRVLD